MNINIKDLVRSQMAQQIIAAIPEEERKKLLEASLTKTLKEALRPWAVESVIKADIEKYMVEYLKNPDVQEGVKKATEEAVDELMVGVIYTIIYKSQDAIKSNYEKFIKEKTKHE